MKYSMYLYEGDLSSDEFRENLLKEAVENYCRNHRIEWDEIVIHRAEKGKPYILGTHRDVYCNVSHTENMWICMVGEAECGIDLQKVKECRYEQLAKRYFTPEDQAYVQENGIQGFFKLWVRREAFCKYTGEGFFGRIPPLTDGEGSLNTMIADGFLQDIPIADDLLCTFCTGGEDDEIEFFG